MTAELPSAILFDADGTLYDSEQIHYETNRVTAQELYGFDFTWELYEAKLRRGTHTAVAVIEEHGIAVDHETFLERRSHHQRLITPGNLKPMPGVVPFLEWCGSQDIRCGVVSAARLATLEVLMADIAMQSYFEEIITFEDVGDRMKPDAFPYELGLSRLGVAPDRALAVEDTAKGIASAQAADLSCVGIRNPYNDDTELRQADLIISHYDELRQHLTGATG